MSNYAEILGLDPETVQIMADTYSGYALSRERQEITDHTRVWTASSWLIGALFQCLNEPAAAKPMFVNAARHYTALEMPIWRICYLCANTYDDNIGGRQERTSYQTSEDLFYQALQVEFGDYGEKFIIDGQRRIRGFELMGTIPQLNIPYESVMRALRELNYAKREASHRSYDNVGAIVRRMNEITDLYRHDEYWTRMQGQFIPFEPAALAISLVIVKKWRDQEGSVGMLIKNLQLKRREDYLLRIANELLKDEATNERN